MVEIIIDRNKCEGKAKCLECCPEDVFEFKEPNPSELSWHSRLRLRFHGGRQAFAIKPENCTACYACVENCPEGAISIREEREKNNPEDKLPKSPFPHWLSFVLVSRLRRFFDNPRKIIEQSGIRESQRVLEVGCGPGFFTEAIAQKVGLNGKVIAQDVQKQMLEKLKKRMAHFPVRENIELLLASSSKIGLPSESIDFIFAANVFEEIEREGETAQTAKELYRLLKPEGLLFFGEHRVPAWLLENILKGIEKAGFKQAGTGEKSFFYSALFRKDKPLTA